MHPRATPQPQPVLRRRRLVAAAALAGAVPALLGACAGARPQARQADDLLAWANRIGWGADSATLLALQRQGLRDHLSAQLHPPATAALPAEVQARIDALPLLRQPMDGWLDTLAQRRSAALALPDGPARREALQAHQQAQNALAQDAATRALLRAVHAPNQLQEQLAWFWFNHFNVYQGKADLRSMVGDYEQRLRELALGRFGDLLLASATHAAMLRYLDNAQNAVRRRNENYARELMELHTLGASGGYTQADVQELSRVLTGLGVRVGSGPAPTLAPALLPLYWRQGATEFHPARHDMGEKRLLGRRVPAGGGWQEILDQLARLARHPATARHVSTRLAQHFASDRPEPAMVERMAGAFTASDGSIAHTLQAMFDAPEFPATLGGKFKTPQQFLVSAVRLLQDGNPVPETAPLLAALRRMGQGLYQRRTPDGYPLDAAAWSGSGQMAARFEVARGLVQGAGTATPVQLAVEARLDARTRQALDATASPRERQWLLLCSPPFQYR